MSRSAPRGAAANASPASTQRLASKLDTDAIVFDGDRDLGRALLSNKRFARSLRAREAAADSTAARRRLLLSALALDARMAPEPARALERAKSVLGLAIPVELYCVSDTRINAFAAPPVDSERGPLLLGLTSEAIERLDSGELAFVLGHEIGHVLLGHFQLSVADLAGADDVAPADLARLAAWMRYAELSADRVGLLVCDDFDTAVRAFFKLTSGLTQARYLGHAQTHASQLAKIRGSDLESSPEDWFLTHPYSPLRVKALDLFARSETFHSLAGRGRGEARFHRMLGKSGEPLSEAELEREVSAILSIMNPSFLSQRVDVAARTRELLAQAGVAVALADGRLSRSEETLLTKWVGKRGLVESAEALRGLSSEKRLARVEELATELVRELSPLACRKLIEDLIAVALADRELARTELAIIAEIARWLGVRAESVEQSVNRMLQTLD